MVKVLSLTKKERDLFTFQIAFKDSSNVLNKLKLTTTRSTIPNPRKLLALLKKVLKYDRTTSGANGKKNENSFSTCSELTSVILASMNAAVTTSGISVRSRAYAIEEALEKQ